MKFGFNQNEIEVILQGFEKFPQVKEVIIFGSRALGNYKLASDIDLAIKGSNIDLTLLGTIKAYFEETTALPYFFDLLDYHTITNSELKKHIDQYGLLIYQKS